MKKKRDFSGFLFGDLYLKFSILLQNQKPHLQQKLRCALCAVENQNGQGAAGVVPSAAAGELPRDQTQRPNYSGACD